MAKDRECLAICAWWTATARPISRPLRAAVPTAAPSPSTWPCQCRSSPLGSTRPRRDTARTATVCAKMSYPPTNSTSPPITRTNGGRSPTCRRISVPSCGTSFPASTCASPAISAASRARSKPPRSRHCKYPHRKFGPRAKPIEAPSAISRSSARVFPCVQCTRRGYSTWGRRSISAASLGRRPRCGWWMASRWKPRRPRLNPSRGAHWH